jgi:hypothetical protein
LSQLLGYERFSSRSKLHQKILSRIRHDPESTRHSLSFAFARLICSGLNFELASIFATILPDSRFALKLMAMTFLVRLRDAWDCAECRFYRRAALALGALVACAWFLL